jgi:putative Holliday junction resolvase
MRLMAIDYGAKAIGVAISDELQLTVRPLTTIRRAGQSHARAVEQILEMTNEHEVGALIVGLPLNMDGTRGQAVIGVEKFISDLRRRLTIPIATVDERLTSYEADQVLREMGLSLRQRREKSDEYAATIILQDYIDGQKRQPPSDNSPSTSSQ